MTTTKRVKAADRTLDLFEAFARSKRPLTLSEVSKAIDMPVSSCHVLLRTLTSRGYVTTFDQQRLYYPSKLLSELSGTLLANNPVLAIISPLLQALRDHCGETVVLGKRLGNQVIYLDVYETPKTIRFSARVSTLRDLHSSALGKALLEQMPEAERVAFVAGLNLQPITGHTLTDAASLLTNIREGLDRGWQLTDGESVDDVMAVARGVSLASEPYAVAIAGPLARVQPRLHEHAHALLATLHNLRAEAG